MRNAIKNNNKEILKEMLNEKVYSYVEKICYIKENNSENIISNGSI